MQISLRSMVLFICGLQFIPILSEAKNLRETKSTPNISPQLAEAMTVYTPLTPEDFTAAQMLTGLNMFNSVRRLFAKQYGVPDMRELTMDWNLTMADQKYITYDNGADWFYEDSIIPAPPCYNHLLNFDNPTLNSTFNKCLTQYEGLSKEVNGSYLKSFHDTFTKVKSSIPANTLSKAFDIINLRLFVQAPSFILSKCNTTSFCNYMSCFINLNNKKGEWDYWYLPPAVNPKVKKMTLNNLKRTGRFAVNPSQRGPSGGAFSIWLLMDKKDWPPATDVPFTFGKQPASECPNDVPYDNDGLCSATRPGLTI